MEIVIAADLGGTNLRVAAVSREGKILSRSKAATPQSDRAEVIVREIVEAVKVCEESVQNEGEVRAIAVAVPGIVSVERGLIIKAPNLPALDRFRITAALKGELGIDVVLENDANAAAIGEHAFGAAREYSSTIMITLGTGIGGGIIIDRKILRGIDGTAGEIGHICVEPHGVPCGCGSRGCIEQYASATAIVRLAGELEVQYPTSSLNGRQKISSREVFEAGVQGDDLALEVFRQAGFYLGIAIADLLNILNPEAIVIGGGVVSGWDLLMPHVYEEMKQRAYRENTDRVKIVRAQLGDDAGILGAAYLGFNHLVAR